MKLKRPPVIFNLIKNIGDQFAQLYRFLFQLEIPRQKFPQEILIFFIRDVLFVEIVFIDENRKDAIVIYPISKNAYLPSLYCVKVVSFNTKNG